ncbi:MAG: cyanophycinase [Candidatus Acidiferrales bacterium]
MFALLRLKYWQPVALAIALLACAAAVPLAAQSQPQPHDPLATGHLIAVGGAMRDPAILGRFIALAGGPDAPIVVIPTAGAGDQYDSDWVGLRAFRAAGARNLRILHTRDRNVANSEAFVAPLRAARGVFIAGGRQTRLAKAYLDTRTHRELRAVLERGGVVGGSSAGASILASFLMRGDTRSNKLPVGQYVRGFGLLPHSAIDQHVLKRNRQFDLAPIVRAHPELLGIGIDEDTAIVISGDEFEVIGQSYVIIHDAQYRRHPGGPATQATSRAPADSSDSHFAIEQPTAPPHFYFLAPGDRFNLLTRQPLRNGRAFNPLPRNQPAESPASP